MRSGLVAVALVALVGCAPDSVDCGSPEDGCAPCHRGVAQQLDPTRLCFTSVPVCQLGHSPLPAEQPTCLRRGDRLHRVDLGQGQLDSTWSSCDAAERALVAAAKPCP